MTQESTPLGDKWESHFYSAILPSSIGCDNKLWNGQNEWEKKARKSQIQIFLQQQ